MALTDFQEALLTTFISELEEFTDELDNDIVALEHNPDDVELINKIFRAYHSIKSSAGIVGYKSISDFTHIIETVFEKIRQSEVKIDNNITSGLLDSNDILRRFLDGIQENSNVTESQLLTPELKEKIEKVKSIFTRYYNGNENAHRYDENNGINTVKEPANSVPRRKIKVYDILFKPNRNFFESGNEPLLYIRDLAEHGTILQSRLNTEELPALSAINPYQCYLNWNIVFASEHNKQQITDMFMFIIDDNDIRIEEIDFADVNTDDKALVHAIQETLKSTNRSHAAQIKNEIKAKYGVIKKQMDAVLPEPAIKPELKTEENKTEIADTVKHKLEKVDYVKVDIKKLDELLNLIGELVINYSQVQNLIITEQRTEKNQDILNTMETFHRLTKEIQEKVMKVRMLPIGPMFNQFYRFVRDTAQMANKRVKLVLSGTDTELDKTLIEKITDPLRHIVRNAIDHGIEESRERNILGKPEEGTIVLSAYHKEGNVVVEIQDDGRGMNPEKILKRAIERNLIAEEDAKNLSQEQITNFIFEPGFSTADTITDLSGRGVGMDVVKNNIEQLRGTVHVLSQSGKGTTIRIIIPLTLSIIEGMIIRVADLMFVVNIMSVVEIIKPEDHQIQPVEEKAEVVNVRDEFLPLVRLYNEFHIDSQITRPSDGVLIIVETDNKKFCILADELVAQQQVVIKGMDKLLDNGFGITGTTILGDGKIAFIIDIPSFIAYLINRNKSE